MSVQNDSTNLFRFRLRRYNDLTIFYNIILSLFLFIAYTYSPHWSFFYRVAIYILFETTVFFVITNYADWVQMSISSASLLHVIRYDFYCVCAFKVVNKKWNLRIFYKKTAEFKRNEIIELKCLLLII